MSTLADVEAASEKMSAAQHALLDYSAQPEPRDPTKNHVLLQALKAATEEYLRLVVELE
jgi:hypothetical protein